MTEPRFFRTQGEWRKWLATHHAKSDGLLVGFHKVKTGKGGLAYQEALDVALAYGWIDGRRFGGAEHWKIRFTPRRPKSIWSAVNIRRVGELDAAGLMDAAGLAAFEKRDPTRQKRYSFENRNVALSRAFEQRFKANKTAWEDFQSRPPSYRRPATWWVMSAVKEETRERRLATLIADSAAGRKIKPLTSPAEARKDKAK